MTRLRNLVDVVIFSEVNFCFSSNEGISCNIVGLFMHQYYLLLGIVVMIVTTLVVGVCNGY